mmetsp:Transcript_4851/g.30951  ORF Transcript_4851/g.30951 Transcript_4851/m.30951 type:complete len:188 (+) Transcript_4851:1833-2396(+)
MLTCSRPRRNRAPQTWNSRDVGVHKRRYRWYVGNANQLKCIRCVSMVQFRRSVRCECHRQVLGVAPSATPSEIKDAYRKLVMIHHPDRGGDQETFLRIQKSYEALSGKQFKLMNDVVRLSEEELQRARARVKVAEERYQRARRNEEEGRLAQERAGEQMQAFLNILLYAWPLSYVVAVLLQAKGFHR